MTPDPKIEFQRVSRWLLRIGVVLILISPMPVLIHFMTASVLERGVVSLVNARVKRGGADPAAFVGDAAGQIGPGATGLVFWQESQDVSLALGGVFLLSVLVSIGFVLCAAFCFWARPVFVPVDETRAPL